MKKCTPDMVSPLGTESLSWISDRLTCKKICGNICKWSGITAAMQLALNKVARAPTRVGVAVGLVVSQV